MKKLIVFLVAALLTLSAVVFVAFRNPVPEKGSENSIVGTWQLESYKYGSTANSFTSITPYRPHIKLIAENRFLWATYDASTKRILESAGGSYELKGESYIESIDFGFGMDSYLGSKSVFKIKVEDGMFYLTGQLSDGYKIEEVWQKIK